jgi:hypothetical protein
MRFRWIQNRRAGVLNNPKEREKGKRKMRLLA